MRDRSLIFLLALIPAFSHAASFDCAKAQTQVERDICENPNISELDGKLGKEYWSALTKANNEEKQRLITEQRHWRKESRDACVSATCLKHAYWSRLAEVETFFAPHSSLFKKEAEKGGLINRVLMTEPFYESTLSNAPFCHQILADLRRMKGVHFVDPIVQTQSYEDPALDLWKGQCKERPLNMSVVCVPDRDGTIPDDKDGTLGLCEAGYGLPPFKLFELPPLKPSERRRYVFYSDDDYGPMNQDWVTPHLGGGYAAGFSKFVFPGCKNQGSSVPRAHGSRSAPNYNSIIEYRGQYYLLFLSGQDTSSYWLSIEPLSQSNQICEWGPVKSENAKQERK